MRKLFFALANGLAIAMVVAKRLRHHLGLTLSTLVGIISVLSLVICVPLFTNAVVSQVLKQTLTDKSVTNHRSLFSLHVYFQPTSLFNTLVMLVLLFGGLGLIFRSLKAIPAPPETENKVS